MTSSDEDSDWVPSSDSESSDQDDTDDVVADMMDGMDVYPPTPCEQYYNKHIQIL